MAPPPDQGCLLPSGIGGIPTESALLAICAAVLLFKRCREEEGSKRPWADFLLDASKQLIGLLWANLLSAWGLSAFRGPEEGGGCGWLWACTVTDATLGVFIEYLLLNALASILTWVTRVQVRVYKIDLLREELGLDAALAAQQVVTAANAELGLEPLGTVAEQVDRLLDEIGLGCELLEDRVADYRTGGYRDSWGGLAMRKYAKQLLLWLGCIAGMKCLVVFLMDQFSGAFASLAEVVLAPVSWDDDLQLLVVAALTPCCMEAVQAWVTDSFLQQGGLPLSELRPHCARQAKFLLASLSASRRLCSQCGDLQQALLRPGVVKEAAAEGNREAKAARADGVDWSPAGGAGAGAEEAPPAALAPGGLAGGPGLGAAAAQAKAARADGVGVSPAGSAGAGADEASPAASAPSGGLPDGRGLGTAVDGRSAPQGQRRPAQQAAPQEEKLQEAAVQAQEQRLLGLEERLTEKESELQKKLKELEQIRAWLEEQAPIVSPQHSDTASSQRPATPQLPGAPATPDSSLPQGAKEDVEQQSAQSWRSVLRDGASDRSLPRSASQKAFSAHNIDRKIAMLESKIAELQLSRGVEDAFNEFRVAGDGVIQEFLSGSRGCAGIASRVPRRGNLRRGW